MARTKVGTAGVGDRSSWELISLLLDAGVDRMLLYGPPGLGKSATPIYWGASHQREVFTLTVTDGMSSSRLEGHFVVKGGDFVWTDGVVVRAWRTSHHRPVLLLIEEVPEASGDVEVFLHAALNDPSWARLDLPTGETVRPNADNLIVIATMNGDPARDLRPALADRFAVRVHCETVNPAAVEALPEDLRPLAANLGSSIRPLVAFARLRDRGLDVSDAAQAVYGAEGRDVVASLSVASIVKTKGGA